VASFDRYVFAQQDREGAVIDERYNGGGNLDDYMVDYMMRTLRAAITNEVPGGSPMLLPQGILGPKVLLINERAGSGGDYFPWAFRQQQVGPLIGTRTWGGLVKSSTHYQMVDGGSLTAPDNAVFDPINNRSTPSRSPRGVTRSSSGPCRRHCGWWRSGDGAGR
jgi:tricorn protease